MVTLPFTVDQVGIFFLIFVRVVTIITLMPVFGNMSVPASIKVAFSLVITVVLVTVSGQKLYANQIPESMVMFGLLIIKEVMLGVAIGFVASMLFTAVQFAGRLVDTEMGFGFVELVDPFSEELVTVWGQLQVIVFTILFMMINGHYFLLLAVERSFELVPLLTPRLPDGPMVMHLSSLVGSLFEIGLKFAAPIYVPLILTELALGAVARTVPQINIFFVGMPVKIALGLCTAVLVFPMLTGLFKVTFEKMMQDIWRLLFLMA